MNNCASSVFVPARHILFSTEKALRIFVVVIICASFCGKINYGNAAASDPLWDWKYDAIERLTNATGAGLEFVGNTRPLTRIEMAKQTLRIKDKLDSGGGTGWYYRHLMEKLVTELAPEIRKLNGDDESGEKPVQLNWARYKAVRGDIPIRLENDYGFKADRLSGRFEFSASGRLGWLAYEVRPKIDTSETRPLAPEIGSGYVLTNLGNLEIEAGKDIMWWGPGRNGATIMSDNAPAFNLVKLSTAEPVVLPILGPTKLVFFSGQAGNQNITAGYGGCASPGPDAGPDCTQANAYITKSEPVMLNGLRLDMKPLHFLEIGASYIIMLASRNGESYQIMDYLQKTFYPIWSSEESSVYKGMIANYEAAVDMALNFSEDYSLVRFLNLKSLRLYSEYGGETATRDRGSIIPYLQFPSTMIGLYADVGDIDFLVEGLTSSRRVEWYRHGNFLAGMTNQGFIIGHHAGGYVESLYARVGIPFSSKYKASAFFENERHSPANNYNSVLQMVSGGVELETQLTPQQMLKVTYNHRGYTFAADGPMNTELVIVEFLGRF